ncbi:Hypothetical predicted protein [Paramuricea clavata]|uniref:Uncharacterized protein n=1 Tax=Paramuricea clavata TaxID=317549 RepID=A0A6S7FIY0_PARCT|nr:Hypothetical predicted protein [Paramuricea clavata]
MVFKIFLKHSRNIAVLRQPFRHFCCTKLKRKQGFSGVLCDIDGVLLRGRQLIPGARESIKTLYDQNIPVVFLTNQGLQLETDKAESLSDIFDIQVKPEQVVLSHSPMRLNKDLLDKFVLVLEDIRTAYPLLDMVDKGRRYEKLNSLQTESNIPDVEGIVLLGEPVRWESALQLCVDLLVSNGNPSKRLDHIPDQHIPVVACNTDLLWMAEAPLPRFGHGAFLLCLESLYQKITGHSLNYGMITGKPFLITYKYAERIIEKYLQSKFSVETSNCLKRIYVIGDNPDTDIYGGNLYKEHIKHSLAESENIHSTNVANVISVLVATGVHSKGNLKTLVEMPDHVHKDVIFQPNMRTPDYNVENITEAVRLIIENERT